MGHYETEFWLNDTWGESRSERQSGRYYPYTPDLIAHKRYTFTPATLDSVAEAHARISQLGAKGARAESIARVLLRSEALSSSRIEGLELSVAKLLVAEELRRIGVSQNPGSVASVVLGNTDMMLEAIHLGSSASNISVETLCHMHRLLLKGTHAEAIGGLVRTTQNWIGGNRMNPIGAAYVPPQPHKVIPLLKDLVEFCNVSEYPSVIKAAIAHAQFETIHPFSDGNGRTGRALVHVLTSSLGAVPPFSLVLLADKEHYIDHLGAFRLDGQNGDSFAANAWVDYFAQALVSACARAEALDGILLNVQDGWAARIHFRRGSAGSRILSLLVSHPVITVARAAELTGGSKEACRLAIRRLVDAGILVQSAKNRKSDLYVASDVVEAITAYERAVSTRSGSTREEHPHGKVPQRQGKGVFVPPLG